MNKLLNLLAVLLLALTMCFMTSCEKEEEVKFDFDDQYFVGVQEHFYEIRAMEKSVTTDFICDLNAAMGTKVFRLNVTMNKLFYVDVNDTVKFNNSIKEQMHIIVDKLLASGVERIVYATDTFIYPYGYKATHEICAPDPYYERDAYVRWLTVNSVGYGMMAAEFPEIKYFEPINEPDIPNNEVVCKNGMIWGSKQAEFMYTAKDEANILVDLCYYIRKEIKKVDEKCMMMTPALATLASSFDFLDYMYKGIESGAHPVGDSLPCSVDPDDYFDIIDLHPYTLMAEQVDPLNPTESSINLCTDAYIEGCNKFYQICCNHGDAEKPHWYTEIGFTDNGTTAGQAVAGREALIQLNRIHDELPFVECVIYYKMTDNYEYTVSLSEDHFGLFTAVKDPDAPLAVKPIMQAIYSFMHNGSTDYSVFDEIRNKYCK